ncbi:3-deoxy-D-manno-octulosonic acid transferase [Desulforhopalus sp. 52FAK]
MFILYNMLQLLFLVVFCPFILIFVLCSSKYRDRIPARLGFGLKAKLRQKNLATDAPVTFWIHALSVGETTSAEPLIRGLKTHYPHCKIIFSVTTKSGKHVADTRLKTLVDVVLDGPLDILPVVHYFHLMICPDFFILVETDFWPNNLLLLKQKNVPTILVNGRVSEKSITGYKRMPFFFGPMFKSFSALCMQTAGDKSKMESLGIPAANILTLGNLKFDTPEFIFQKTLFQKHLPSKRTVFICGSTHPGEEELLISSYLETRHEYPELFLIIAPRNIKRAGEIKDFAIKQGLSVALKTEPDAGEIDILILNTIGELAAYYSICQIAFVGGSLVAKGGHNPIEPASMGVPVLFGPHMEDFSEIAESLITCGGGKTVRNTIELGLALRDYVNNIEHRETNGAAAKAFVNNHRGVIRKHIDLIQTLL